MSECVGGGCYRSAGRGVVKTVASEVDNKIQLAARMGIRKHSVSDLSLEDAGRPEKRDERGPHVDLARPQSIKARTGNIGIPKSGS